MGPFGPLAQGRSRVWPVWPFWPKGQMGHLAQNNLFPARIRPATCPNLQLLLLRSKVEIEQLTSPTPFFAPSCGGADIVPPEGVIWGRIWVILTHFDPFWALVQIPPNLRSPCQPFSKSTSVLKRGVPEMAL